VGIPYIVSLGDVDDSAILQLFRISPPRQRPLVLDERRQCPQLEPTEVQCPAPKPSAERRYLTSLLLIRQGTEVFGRICDHLDRDMFFTIVQDYSDERNLACETPLHLRFGGSNKLSLCSSMTSSMAAS